MNDRLFFKRILISNASVHPSEYGLDGPARRYMTDVQFLCVDARTITVIVLFNPMETVPDTSTFSR